MKCAKSFLIAALAIFLLGGLAPGLWAAEPPRGDFTLSDGRLRIRNTDDPVASDIFNKHLFARLKIEVKDGAVSGGTWITVPERMEGVGVSRRTWSGTNSIALSGTHDPDTGEMRGKFKIEQDVKYTTDWAGGEGAWKGQLKGGFSGVATGGDQAVLTFKGTGNTQGRWRHNDQNAWEEINDSISNLFKAAFTVAPDKPAAEPQAKPEEDEEEVNRMGDEFDDKTPAGIIGVTGQVELLFPGESRWRLAKTEMKIPPGTRVRTTEDSYIVLGFRDMTTFRLKPESQIVYAPKGQINESNLKVKIKQVAGTIMTNVENMIKNGSMEVEMNQAVAGIKGTRLVTEERDGKSTLKVLRGIVVFRAETGGERLKVGRGEMIIADKAGLGDKTEFEVDAELASWTALSGEAKPAKGLPLPGLAAAAAGLIVLAIIGVTVARRRTA